jgi:hypothetical protein
VGQRGRKAYSPTPRRLSGRHGGAVPARPVRGNQRKTSPWHHGEHHTIGVHTHTVISSMKHRRHQEAAGEVAGSVASEGDFPSGIQPGSPRRGDGQQMHLVELKEGVKKSNSPKVAAAAELAGVGRSRQAAARRLGFARGRLGSERGGE